MSAGRRPINQWFGISCAGAALLIAGWLMLFSWLARDGYLSFIRAGSVSGNLWFWALLIAIGGSGGWLTYWSQNKMSEGVREELWDERDLVSARKTVRYIHKAVVVTFAIAAIFWVVGMVRDKHALMVGYWPAFLLVHWANALVGNFRESQPPGMAPTRMFPVTAEPIRSERWGTR